MSNEFEGQQVFPQDKNTEEIRQKKTQSGELVVTDFADLNFPFLFDTRFLNSPNYEALISLNIPKITVEELGKVVKDLDIKQKLTITQQIGQNGEKAIIPELGIGAWAVSATVGQFKLDPDNPKTFESLRDRLPQQIAHEATHFKRWQSKLGGYTLGHALVSEGIATVYEEKWGRRPLKTPWGHALTKQQLLKEWERAKYELNSNNYSHNEWFFDRTGKHPRWSGYTLGRVLVEGWMNSHPKVPLRDVVCVPTAEILTGTSFPTTLDKLSRFLPRR